MTWTLDQARRVWAVRQRLGRPARRSLDALVAETGWIRTLGGVEAYVALHARCPGITVDQVHRAIAAGDLRVVPCVRGCIYLVPKQDVALALATGATLSARRRATDLGKAGVSPAEMATLQSQIAEVLSHGPTSSRGLRSALPPDAIRPLGAIGKKVGLSSTLPPALREMEFSGLIRRQPLDDRLDHERYNWVLQNPTEHRPPNEDGVASELAERYFRWAGTASVDAFATWTGLGKRVAKKATEALPLRPVDIEGVGDAHLSQVESVPPPTEQVVALPGLDNLHQLRLDPHRFAPSHLHDLTVGAFGAKRVGVLGTVKHLFERMLVVDGRFIGAWAYDPSTHRVEAHTWEPDYRQSADAQAAALTELLAPLGGGKVFSLDNVASMNRRLDRVRGYATRPRTPR